MQASDSLTALNRLFAQALLRMGDIGEIDAACRLAAQGWSLLRHDQPKEAERLNGVMHNLTHPRRNSRRTSPHGGDTVSSTSNQKEASS